LRWLLAVVSCVSVISARSQPVGAVTITINGVVSISNYFLFDRTNVVQVEISAVPLPIEILYSLDDTDPYISGQKYTGPFYVTTNVAIRAVARFVLPAGYATNGPVFVEFDDFFYLTTSTSGGGGIEITNGAGPYRSNTIVTLMATNLPGWSLSGFLGDLDTNSVVEPDTIQLLMNRHRSVRVLFQTGETNEMNVAGGPLKLAADYGVGQVAYVQVHIGPPEAVLAGAGWLFEGQTNYSSNPNFTVAVLSNQTARIVFKSVSNWATPPSELLSVPLGQLTVHDATYRSNVAFVQVQLGPPAALASGGGWRAQGQTNYTMNSTSIVEVVTISNKTIVEFKPIPAWEPLESREEILPTGELTVLTANYSVTPPVFHLNPSVGLSLTGTTGTTYRIEYRTNLAAGVWLALQTNTLDVSVNLLFPWPPTNGPSAFYRAVWLP